MSAIFGWDREMLEGRTKSSREWREQVDPWWSERLGIPHLTPRWILQYVGTDVIRGKFHDDMWLASLENKLRKTTDDIVISDVRFKNEVKMLKNLGAICIEVTRGDKPNWYNDALSGNTSQLELLKIHKSEYDWIGTDFDYTLDNNGTLDDVYTQVETVLSAKRQAKDPQASMLTPASV
jgi:hypothetical protein